MNEYSIYFVKADIQGYVGTIEIQYVGIKPTYTITGNISNGANVIIHDCHVRNGF